MGAAPANVLEFAGKMRFVGGKHCFTFCTHGTSYRAFHPSLYPVLTGRGLVVIGSADWYGDCHLLHMPQPYPTAGHPDDIDLQEAEVFGRDMAVRSMRISAGETDLVPPAPAQIPKPPACRPRRHRVFCQASQVRPGEVSLPELHPVHGQLPYPWDRPFGGSAGAGTALLGLRVLRAALSHRGIGYERVGADH